MQDYIYKTYVKILEQELVPAMGCTEPIAVAYAAAIARKRLEAEPDRVDAYFSGNIIKNVKSVVVPNTKGCKGLSAAIAAGIISNRPEAKLEVLAQLSKDQVELVRNFMERCPMTMGVADFGHVFDIIITLYHGENYVKVRITDAHTNVVLIEKNGVKELEIPMEVKEEKTREEYSLLNMKDIVEFVHTVNILEVEEIISRQMNYNMAIAKAGLEGNYGANIGNVLMKTDQSVRTRAKAVAAAGSDARMNGCELPVVIVSGSGNQGMTASLPVIVYGEELKVTREQLIRAVVLSDLVTIHQKTGIGRLSAYCGAVSAGCGSAAGIAFLHGGDYDAITHAVVNAIAILSGTICDGAKSSCAAKIAMSVEAGILGFEMYQQGQQFCSGDGIVAKGIEPTIQNVGVLARDGMRGTDTKIMEIMLQCD